MKASSTYKNTSDLLTILREPAIAYSALDDARVYELVAATRKGFSFLDFQNIFDYLAFSLQDWSNFLHLSERSIQRYKKEQKSFEALQSERILQIVLLEKLGIEVFGDSSNYHRWLASPNVALGNITPKSLLDNTFGIDVVKNELGRIQHGVLA